MRRESDPSPPLAVRLGLAFILAPLLASEALAITLTVSSLNDSGPGTLRQAILDANASPGPDDVVFSPGLTGMITLTSGELLITGSLTVHGPGAGTLTVSGNDQSRILHVESPADAPIDVTLSGLTLTHGFLPGEGVGGAVFANGENLTILHSVISDSSAGLPGDPLTTGCGGNVGSNGGTLRIASSALTGGLAAGGSLASGGDLCIQGGRLVLERSTLSGGSASVGGGFYAYGLGVDSTILASTISGNRSSVFGGGIFFLGATLTIDSSTISGNTAGLLAPIGNGGGLYVFHGHVQILNSTISGNLANGNGGGIDLAPDRDIFLLLRLATVSSNRASERGGSLMIPLSGEVELNHAIVANGSPQDLAAGLADGVLATVKANYSLIEKPGDVVRVGAHNLVGVDPLLGPLADNGGPTLTHLPLPSSPVIDAGDPAIPSPPATDQRGFARITGARVDLGSVETGPDLLDVPALSPLGLVFLAALLGAAGLRIQAGRRLKRCTDRRPRGAPGPERGQGG